MKRKMPSMALLMGMGALCLAALAYFNPPTVKTDKEMLITCFVGSEPFYSGPIKEHPLVKDNSIFITLGDDATLEFINGTCIIFSSPD